jgi:hypothetical protein
MPGSGGVVGSFGSPAILNALSRPAAFRPYLTARLALSRTCPGGSASRLRRRPPVGCRLLDVAKRQASSEKQPGSGGVVGSFGSPAILNALSRPAAFRPYLTARLALSRTCPGAGVLLALTTPCLPQTTQRCEREKSSEASRPVGIDRPCDCPHGRLGPVDNATRGKSL